MKSSPASFLGHIFIIYYKWHPFWGNLFGFFSPRSSSLAKTDHLPYYVVAPALSAVLLTMAYKLLFEVNFTHKAVPPKKVCHRYVLPKTLLLFLFFFVFELRAFSNSVQLIFFVLFGLHRAIGFPLTGYLQRLRWH